MGHTARLTVTADDLAELRSWVAADRATVRARIVLLSAEGQGTSAVAAEVGCAKQTVITWRERYRTAGLDGLRDAPRSGRPVTVDPLGVLGETLRAGPAPGARWSSRRMAARLGVSNVAVANVWRAWGVVPLPDGRVQLATDPPLEPPPAAVAAVWCTPTVSALALCPCPAGTGDADPERLADGLAALGPLDPLDLGPPDEDTGGAGKLLAALDGGRPGRLTLLVGSAPAELTEWAGDRGVAVHRTPAEQFFTRLARVACGSAARTADGAASVARLRRAADAHQGGRPFTWVDHDS